MKYLKKFENINQEFKIGDYVKIAKVNPIYYDNIIKFLTNNIGIIHSKDEDDGCYNIKYDDVPKNISIYTRYMGTSSHEVGLKEEGEIFIAYKDQLRLATPEEINNHLMTKNMKKYNL